MGGKNFCVGVEGCKGVELGVWTDIACWLAEEETVWPGLRYSSAIRTASLPPIAEARFLISSFSS